MHTAGPGIMQKKKKKKTKKPWKMILTHRRTWNMARNTEKCGKWEMHSVVHGI
jgi:hypothetical protein